MLHQGGKLLLMQLLPLLLLVDTSESNPECPLKPTGSNPPANSKVRCTASSGCKITCKRGHTFHFGERQIFYKCRDGSWHLEGGDPKYYKECTPFCKPACMNGGQCIAVNTCQCLEGWHGRACRRAPAGTASCSPACENGGLCIMNNTCQCLEGYTGQTCHHAVKLVTTSTRPIEYSTSILKQPVEIPTNISDTTTTTTDPTTTIEPKKTTTTETTTATTMETTTTTFTTSSTSTEISTMVVDTNSSITTTSSPPITQVDSSLDTKIVPPTDSTILSQTITGDLLEISAKSSTAATGHRSTSAADYGDEESQYGVDTEDPESDRLDAAQDMDYKQDKIDARLQIDASTKGGCSCSVPWLSQTTMILLMILLMK